MSVLRRVRQRFRDEHFVTKEEREARLAKQRAADEEEEKQRKLRLVQQRAAFEAEQLPKIKAALMAKLEEGSTVWRDFDRVHSAETEITIVIDPPPPRDVAVQDALGWADDAGDAWLKELEVDGNIEFFRKSESKNDYEWEATVCVNYGPDPNPPPSKLTTEQHVKLDKLIVMDTTEASDMRKALQQFGVL